jgi:hypothetical protein
MQGIPSEGYQPLPPNPPEDNYRGEVENQSDIGSVVTPLLENQEGALVMVENPTPHTTSVSVTPLKPLFLRLDSLGNVIDEEVPRLSERDFIETYMGSTEPTFGDEYRTLVRPTTAVDTNPTPARYVWSTSLGCDLYEHFESFRQPFHPYDPPGETGPSGQTMNHPIDQVINPNVASTQVYPSSRATQNYNIVEDLGQVSCAMSTLKVLQHCPSQHRTLLAAIGVVDLESSNHIMFNLNNYASRLSHQLALQVDVVVHNQQIHQTILDEGASTCVMSLACWKGLKTPALNKSPMMLRTFDGRGFHPHGILQSLPI